MTGRFIALEGIEGVGKSTAAAHLCARLAAAGKTPLATREPGGTPFGERLREALLDPGETPEPEAELLLMFAARLQHLRRVIRPALAAGRWVVCDRFVDASYAYQGGGRGLPEAHIAALEAWLLEGLRPDPVILLDAPVPVALARARGRAGAADRFERLDEAFFERVRRAYLDRAAADPDRYRVIDAARPWPEVRAELDRVLDGCLADDGAGRT
ncbi:MAG: thymidylate kinase [Gammaproteobacteria bacterium]|nr:MAG: thymidylate kinase [Gammaproteobacteria bacterium]